VSGSRAIDKAQSNESGMCGMYGDTPFAVRQYTAIVDGQCVKKTTPAQVGEKLGVDPRWVKLDGSPNWPTKANNGFDSGFDGPPTITELQPGHTFDRYGGRFDEKGNFTD
jgi:hypothetical protein